jgi:bacillithiol biosynthesis deacetylase BshB1
MTIDGQVGDSFGKDVPIANRQVGDSFGKNVPIANRQSSLRNPIMPVDLLAIAAHRDDVELTCAGTLIRAADQGHRTAIVDLTAGETGTRGSAEVRAREAEAAGRILGVVERRNAGLPDARLANTDAARRILVEHVRALAPRVVILPYPIGRHPDHRVASELGRDACYLAGLARYDAAGEPHRPFKLLYALAYREDPIKPTFVVDISEQMERKMAAIRCYASQFEGATSAGEIFPTGQDLFTLIEVQSAHYGSLIRRRYGEPFYTSETVLVEDVLSLDVSSI